MWAEGRPGPAGGLLPTMERESDPWKSKLPLGSAEDYIIDSHGGKI